VITNDSYQYIYIIAHIICNHPIVYLRKFHLLGSADLS